MHAVSYADHMLLLEHFTSLLSKDTISEAQLLDEVTLWSSKVNGSLTHAASFQRQVRQLSELFVEKGEGALVARTGLLYLLRSGGPTPQALTAIGLQAHSFVLSIILHRARTVMGRSAVFVPPELSSEDRGRAEEIFSGALDAPLYSDSELIRQTRNFVESPGLPTESLFFRRMLHSAEFLVTVLEGGGYSQQETNYARAALSYLVLEEDSIDDRLGLIGFLDDAYILDMAVSFIEPARKPWMRLIEASSEAETLLAGTTLKNSEGKTSPISGDMLVDAALLSEPMADLGGPLDGALFVPTAGSATVLLGVAVAKAMMKESTSEDGTESLVEFGHQIVVVATPSYRSTALLKTIEIDGKELAKNLPIGVAAEDGTYTSLYEGLTPLLILAPSLGAAGRLAEQLGSRIRMVLVDLEVASGGEAELTEEKAVPEAEVVTEEEEIEDLTNDSATMRVGVPAKTRRPTRTGGDFDVTTAYMGEAGFIPRLTRDQETELSIQMCDGREQVFVGVAQLGRIAITTLKDVARIEDGLLSTLLSLHQSGSKDELRRILAEMALEDDHYAEIGRRYKAKNREAIGLDKVKGRSSTKDKIAAFELETGVSIADFLAGYRQVISGLYKVDEAVGLLTRGNLRLVLWMAKKYRNRNALFLDMVQEGNMGLMRAARKFDHRKGAGFGTYANWWVRQSIERYLSHHSRTIRIPVTALAAVRRVREALRVLERKTGSVPTAKEVAAYTRMEMSEVRRIMRVSVELEHGCVALDGPVDSESGSTYGDFLKDDNAVQPLEELSTRQLGLEARKLLESLEPLEAKVLRMRFGIGNDTRHTLEDIGNQVGLTRERIRQIEIKALGKLKFRAKRMGVRP